MSRKWVRKRMTGSQGLLRRDPATSRLNAVRPLHEGVLERLSELHLIQQILAANFERQAKNLHAFCLQEGVILG